VGAFDRLFAVFGEGQEHVKALVAVVADKVIGWHGVILTEFLVRWVGAKKAIEKAPFDAKINLHSHRLQEELCPHF
jgi:hypothetical protein